MIGPGLRLLCDSWTLLIIDEALRGACRFSEWRQRLPIPNSVLSRRLATLTADQVFTHATKTASNPPGSRPASYGLTPSGQELWRFVCGLHAWQTRWQLPSHLGHMYHARCGRSCVPRVSCACAPPPLNWSDIHLGAQSLSVPLTANEQHLTAGRPRNKGTNSPINLPLHSVTLTAVGSRWSAEILVAALMGARRFGQFLTWLGIPPAVLSARLHEFTKLGIITTAAATSRADRGAYDLTTKGRELFAPLILAAAWQEKWIPTDGEVLTQLRHKRCGKLLTPELRCNNCHAVLHRRELQLSRKSPIGRA